MRTQMLLLVLLVALSTPARGAEIHDAVSQGDMARLTALLVKDPLLVSAADAQGDLPLHVAARAGNAQAVAFLLEKGADIDGGDRDNSTPLDVAASEGQAEVARVLLERGAAIDRQDNNGNNAIHFAAFRGDSTIVRLLLEKGAPLDAVRSDGLTPLMAAIYRGDTRMARLFVDAGADLNARLGNGAAALNVAAERGNLEMVGLFLAKGASASGDTAAARSPLHSAAFGGHTEIADLLISHGAPVDARDQWGATPLNWAARRGHAELCGLLIDKGASVDMEDEEGLTPLLIAVGQGHGEAVELLLDRGAQAGKAESHYGHTSLHLASLQGDHDMVVCLMEHDADVQALDSAGRTPLWYAAKYGHKDVADLLKKHGAKAKDLQENYGTPRFLTSKLKNGEAALWHLGHCGWAIRTPGHFLIFDYFSEGDDPACASLTNGHVNPAEIGDRDVYVFVTHGHRDHFDAKIFPWKEAIPHLTYIYGFRPEELPENRGTGYSGPAYEYIGPRDVRELGGMKIRTIRANDIAPGVGFFVEVDGVGIYHAGDHAGWAEGQREGFTQEIDYLAALSPQVDLAFCNVTGCHAHGEVPLRESFLYTMEKLHPKVMIPTHAGGREFVYSQFVESVKDRTHEVRVVCPENRGDSYLFHEGRID
ncbi:ankyrin repeat domain-containing protein [Candidatus Fermentibacteria bacterium]|nr:ankyrin repeat domain-containing protein [Candidatus Fermentibacteria bacterium]